jgi:hypothetical protein
MNNKSLKALINDNYNKYINDVNLYYNAYMNEDIITESTLPEFPRETTGDYDLRKNSAIRINYFKFFVDLYFKALFSKEDQVNRDIKSFKLDTDIINNIDLQKHSTSYVVTQAGKHALIGKQSYLWIDTPAEPNNYSRPFVKILRFQNVLDWEFDRYGDYNWILIQQEIQKPIEEWIDKSVSRTELQYTYISKSEYRVLDKDGNLMLQHPNSINEVPVVKVSLTDEDFDGMGEGVGKDLVPIDLEIMNIMSLDKTEYSFNNFHILVLPMESKPTNTEEEIKIGEHNVFYRMSSEDKVEWVSPSQGTYDIREKRLNFFINEMLRITGFKGKDEAVTKSAQSGVSKLFDYINTSETLSNIANILSNIELKMFYYMYKMNNTNNTDDFDTFSDINKVSYPKRYDLISIDKELENLYNSLNYGISDLFEKKAKERITDILLSDYATKDELEQIKKDIDESYNQEESETEVIEDVESEQFQNITSVNDDNFKPLEGNSEEIKN